MTTDSAELVEFSAITAASSNARVAGRMRLASVVLASVAAGIAVFFMAVLAFSGSGQSGQLDVFTAAALAASAAAVLAATGTRPAMLIVHRCLCLLAAGIAVWAICLACLAAGGSISGSPAGDMGTAVAVGLGAIAAASLATARLTLYVGQAAGAAAVTLSVATLAQTGAQLEGGVQIATVVAFAVPCVAVGTMLARPRIGAMRVVTAAGPFGSTARRLILAALLTPFAAAFLLTDIPIGDADKFGVFSAMLLVLLGGFAIIPLSVAASAVAQTAQAEQSRRRETEAREDAVELTAAISEYIAPGVVSNETWQLLAVSEAASGHLAGDVVFADKAGSRLYFFVVDVAGHGPRAALFAVIAKNRLTVALDSGCSPSEALAALEVTCRSCDEVATAFVCAAAQDGSVLYASAGHPPAVVAGGSTVARLDATGPLLGAGGQEWEQLQIELGSGQCVVVISDGIIESRSQAGVEWGVTRLESIALHRAAEGIDVVVEAILDDARTHAGPDGFRDDVTVVIASRR